MNVKTGSGHKPPWREPPRERVLSQPGLGSWESGPHTQGGPGTVPSVRLLASHWWLTRPSSGKQELSAGSASLPRRQWWGPWWWCPSVDTERHQAPARPQAAQQRSGSQSRARTREAHRPVGGTCAARWEAGAPRCGACWSVSKRSARPSTFGCRRPA